MGLFNFFKSQKTDIDIIGDCLEVLIEKADFQLSFDMKEENSRIYVDLFGEDEDLLTQHNGQLLDSIQSYLIKVLQHQKSEGRTLKVVLNVGSFREELKKNLIQKAKMLKKSVVSKKKPVFFHPLSAKNRKIIHEFFSKDEQLETLSVGYGDFKKIKLFFKNSNRH